MIGGLAYIVTAAPSIGWEYVSAPAALVLLAAIVLRAANRDRTAPPRLVPTLETRQV